MSNNIVITGNNITTPKGKPLGGIEGKEVFFRSLVYLNANDLKLLIDTLKERK